MKFVNSILISAILSLSLFSCTESIIDSSISMMEFKKIYSHSKKIHIIDVRTSIEFNGPLGHVPTAINRPLSDIDNTISELKNSIDVPIYVICLSGSRSKRATKILTEHGINAINVKGGMKAWNQ